MIEDQSLYEVDRTIHEPARLMIATILFAVDQADFLYLLNETGFNERESLSPPVEIGEVLVM